MVENFRIEFRDTRAFHAKSTCAVDLICACSYRPTWPPSIPSPSSSCLPPTGSPATSQPSASFHPTRICGLTSHDRVPIDLIQLGLWQPLPRQCVCIENCTALTVAVLLGRSPSWNGCFIVALVCAHRIAPGELHFSTLQWRGGKAWLGYCSRTEQTLRHATC